MSALYKLPLVLDPQPEGGFVVTCPELPELVTEGDTIEEGLRHASDALQAVLELYEDLGRPLSSLLQAAAAGTPIAWEPILAA